MNALVVYESAWGNTRLVAEAISDGLSPHLTAEVVAAHQAPPLAELKVDLLVVGAPTHAFGLPRDGTREDAHARGGELIPSGVREWLDAAEPASLAVATFDTHVRHPDLPGHAGKKAAKKLRKLGCHPVTDPETFYVDGYEGPLLPGELERAREWGDGLTRGDW
ncbi:MULTISPECIES: flavodoxin domain-containing protein [Dietzia]|uniref:flavodoxin family protein n=1 Tax=Dietzia TaxID=37914 RepID=UPI0021176248|nr:MULTISPECIES: flavodoxin domain-containing protein [Dietzia]